MPQSLMAESQLTKSQWVYAKWLNLNYVWKWLIPPANT